MGIPGRVIAIAHAARGWDGGDAPLPLPPELEAAAARELEALPAWPGDLAGWIALLREPVALGAIARVTLQTAARIAQGLDALTAAGVLSELPGPPETRWAFRDRVVRATAAARLDGTERRRRHAAILVAGRAAGDPPARADPPRRRRLRPGGRGGLLPARRGARPRAGRPGGRPGARRPGPRLVGPRLGESARLAALHHRGMALLDLSQWLEATEMLEQAARGRRDLQERDAALASISAASSARWILGQHELALRSLQDHLTRSRDAAAAPSAARGEALTHAAGMAVMSSRFAEAMALAGEARAEASAAGADETSTRALIFMGMAESGRSGPEACSTSRGRAGRARPRAGRASATRPSR